MRSRLIVLSTIILLGIPLLLAGCGSPAAPAPPATGSLEVVVNGLPGGLAGAVTVTGPAAYSKLVTATTTLTVDPGTYTVSVAQVSDGASIVPALYDGAASKTSLDATAGNTVSTTVTYALRPGSGSLWVPIAQPAGTAPPPPTPIADAYLDSTLGAGGTPPADVSLTGTAGVFHEGIAFDGAGNMWVADLTGMISEYAVADLASSGSPTPSVTIDASAYGGVIGLAFDASGDLWASFHAGIQVLAAQPGTQIVMYTPAQLAAGGAVTPAVVLGSHANSLSSPAGMAFDAAGGLWVANANSGVSTIVHFAPADLATTGNPTPDIVISSDGTSLSAPYGIAFDASGNLWVADHGNGNVMRYDASQIAATGNPTPALTIGTIPTYYGGGLTPTGIAFDHNGDLWVAVPSADTLARFSSPDALTGTVSPAPDLEVGTGPIDAGLIAFDPPPSGLNIHTP